MTEQNLNRQILSEALDARPTTAHQLHYMALGATLYMPATRSDLAQLLNQEKLPGLRSVVICTEDAVQEWELSLALDNLRQALEQIRPAPLLRFVRPRNTAVLAELLRLPGIEHLDGFVLPKVSEANLPVYGEITARQPQLHLMPTLETDVAFSRPRLERLRTCLEELANPVLCLRIGGNDLLALLSLKRPKHLTVYDTPLRSVIDDLIVTFRPAGFELSAPVFEHLDSQQTLQREVEMDLAHGLWAKTAIHPTQVPLIEAAYRVSASERELAGRVLEQTAPAVFRLHGQMAEPRTHQAWARRLLLRAQIYGEG